MWNKVELYTHSVKGARMLSINNSHNVYDVWSYDNYDREFIFFFALKKRT